MRIIISFVLIVYLGGCSKKPSLSIPTPIASTKSVSLGTFEVTSENMVVSDPCYYSEPINTDISEVIKIVKKGEWRAEAGIVNLKDWGERCSELIAFHSGWKTSSNKRWVFQNMGIPVDSGQAGIYDIGLFGNNSVVPKDYRWKEKPIDPEQPWYSLCCENTCKSPPAGVIPGGVVSGSGFGEEFIPGLFNGMTKGRSWPSE